MNLAGTVLCKTYCIVKSIDAHNLKSHNKTCGVKIKLMGQILSGLTEFILQFLVNVLVTNL